jgi:hypothetical protein
MQRRAAEQEGHEPDRDDLVEHGHQLQHGHHIGSGGYVVRPIGRQDAET